VAGKAFGVEFEILVRHRRLLSGNFAAQLVRARQSICGVLGKPAEVAINVNGQKVSGGRGTASITGLISSV
jgi:hypothetical protein